jgi:hypothetical protein
MPENKNFGKEYVERSAKSTGKFDVGEVVDEDIKAYKRNLSECLEKNKKVIPDQDFFIEVICPEDQLFEKKLHHIYMPQLACPRPTFTQSVFHYHHKENRLEELWTVPKEEVVQGFLADKSQVPPHLYALLSNVIKFDSGELMKLSEQLTPSTKVFEQEFGRNLE